MMAHLVLPDLSHVLDDWLQGLELRKLRADMPFQQIVFCGDGANDLCPALALGPNDIVLARQVTLLLAPT